MKVFKIASFLGLAALISVQSIFAQERLYINPASAQEDGASYSSAVLVDETLYISGILGMVDGQIPEQPEDEASALLDSIQSILDVADMDMDDLVYVQIFASDISQYGPFNRVYRTYFEQEFPARAFIGSGPLLLGATFEIQAIAVKR